MGLQKWADAEAKRTGAFVQGLDVLVDQKFLRKKYKDPITNDDFAIVSALTPAEGADPEGTAGQ